MAVACRAMGSTSLDKCQSIIRNLLKARGAAQHQSAVVYLRQLQQTAWCDKFYNFTDIRQSFDKALCSASMERISSFDETEKDKRKTEQAVAHYHDWVERNLVSARSWPNCLLHQTVHKAERTVPMLTVAGTTATADPRAAQVTTFGW